MATINNIPCDCAGPEHLTSGAEVSGAMGHQVKESQGRWLQTEPPMSGLTGAQSWCVWEHVHMQTHTHTIPQKKGSFRARCSENSCKE